MNRHDVFYRDVPSVTSTSSAPANTNSDAGDGGLLSPLLGGVLGALDKSGVNEGILPPFVHNNFSFTNSSGSQAPLTDSPPLLPFQQISGQPISDVPLPLIYNLTITQSVTATAMSDRPTVTQTIPRSTATIANYVWEHTFNAVGKEAAVPGLGEDNGEPKPIGFSGLFFR